MYYMRWGECERFVDFSRTYYTMYIVYDSHFELLF